MANSSGVGLERYIKELAEFVLPLIKYLRTFVGIQAIYIYALPQDKLIEYYKTMGFNRLDAEDE
ncbi:MAG: hypothetical protein J6P28_07020 [Treponema sp.]|nr:hypothetical protein [Treponema sp.]